MNWLFMHFSPLRRLAEWIDWKWYNLDGHYKNHFTSYVKDKIDLIWFVLNGCTCGSGAHPWKCFIHPWSHSSQLEDLHYSHLEAYCEELEKRIEQLEKK